MAVIEQIESRSTMRKPPAAAPSNGQPAGPDRETALQRLRMMMLIRKFEERTYREYSSPRDLGNDAKEMKIGGFCHLYSGQEAVAVGIASIFEKGKDYLVNGYRCHGHSLALGMEPHAAMAELFGKATGCSKGKGGSMHFFDASVGNMGGHGIVGGHIPLGLGFAFAQKYKNTGGVTFCLFGDGAINQGTHNETLNMASLLKVPAIFIVENNGVAMGTQIERHSAERDLAERGSGYNMPHRNIDGNDIDTVIAEMSEAANRARRGEGPTYLVANTYRFRGHSMSDAMAYRTKDELEKAKLRDPIVLYSARLKQRGIVTDALLEKMDEEVGAQVEAAVTQAEADPNPPIEDRFNDILAEQYPLQK